MRTNQNRVLRCLSIMWAVGQAGVTNLDTGLKGDFIKCINNNNHRYYVIKAKLFTK